MVNDCKPHAQDEKVSPYKRRYYNDAEFRARERARTAQKVRENYARYQELWRQAYLRKKAAKHVVLEVTAAQPLGG
jgi:hypothetical protein